MPEGDTVLRAARALGRSLEGKRLTHFGSSLPRLADANLSGRRVQTVEARGKNLLVRFDDGRALVTHMRMTGSWHLYRPGEPWKKPARLARPVLDTESSVPVRFSAPVVELLSARELDRNPRLRRLGPDVLSAEFDDAEAVRRLKSRARTAIGEALLFQSAVAGVGNVYKSETLFLCGMDPFAPVAFFSDAELSGIMAKARELMSANVDGWPRRSAGTRRTRASGGYWVYGRRGRPCRRCGAPVKRRRQGSAGRSTYWCSVCQPPRASR